MVVAQIYIFTLYTGTKFTKNLIYPRPKFTHLQIYTRPKFTQDPNLHETKFTHDPNLQNIFPPEFKISQLLGWIKLLGVFDMPNPDRLWFNESLIIDSWCLQLSRMFIGVTPTILGYSPLRWKINRICEVQIKSVRSLWVDWNLEIYHHMNVSQSLLVERPSSSQLF